MSTYFQIQTKEFEKGEQLFGQEYTVLYLGHHLLPRTQFGFLIQQM